jgi:retron-type reverse transcriptase
MTAPDVTDLSPERLVLLAHRAARGKRRSVDVARFMLDPWPAAAELSRQLHDRSYQPGEARAFFIEEPKRRLIAALPFADRVVQHLLVDSSMPAFERWFAPQSYACRKGFGTHRALRRAVELHRRHRWVLRLDIEKFFPSIDHELLRRTILPRTPRDLRWLARRIIRRGGPCEQVRHYFPGDDLLSPLYRQRGLPIGNLTSQVWANAFLTPLDHMIGSALGLGHFVRYSDDVLVYAHERRCLEQAKLAIEARCATLRLRLHARKSRIHRTTEAVRFVGFVLARRGDAVTVRLAAETVSRMRARMRTLMRLSAAGLADASAIRPRVVSWLAHAAHGHTRTLVAQQLSQLRFVCS